MSHIKQNGLTAGNSQPVKKPSKYAINFIAVRKGFQALLEAVALALIFVGTYGVLSGTKGVL